MGWYLYPTTLGFVKVVLVPDYPGSRGGACVGAKAEAEAEVGVKTKAGAVVEVELPVGGADVESQNEVGNNSLGVQAEAEGEDQEVNGRAANASQVGVANAHPKIVLGPDFMKEMLSAMQRIAQNQVSAEDTKASIAMREFQRLGPPTYSGEPDPIAANEWLEQVTRFLDTLHVKDDDLRVDLATFQLRENAHQWWKYAKATVEEKWDDFKKAFLAKYIPETANDALRREFQNLIQGNMSVSQYEARFTTLSGYAPELVSTEELKAKRFENGLRLGIKERVVGMRLQQYSTLVEAAMAIEDTLLESKRIRESRSQHGGSSTQFEGHQAKKHKISGGSSSFQGPPQQSRSVPAQFMVTSNRSSGGGIICYQCGQRRHRKSECPQKGRFQGQLQTQESRHVQDRSMIICHQCGEAGHIQRFCLWRGSGQSGVRSQQTQSVQAAPGQLPYRPPQ
ncbi:uncharacterized protein LOC131332874 [Rhododendron vialii]|uniref:uncharacterized protein LOC131332874 n=1 Tax=Rhododendron vialii TaxID=182163 RepID=UPI00265FB965|nr:uncharacterized protein LOC131332874 [Rhododendron vialii]